MFNSYGGVVLNKRGEVLLREVTSHHKGYVWTFPKGRADPGESPEETALREVREETGVGAVILAPLPGVFQGLESQTIYFVMMFDDTIIVGPHDTETIQIGWFSIKEADTYLRMTTHPEGRDRDLLVLNALRKYLLVQF